MQYKELMTQIETAKMTKPFVPKYIEFTPLAQHLPFAKEVKVAYEM